MTEGERKENGGAEDRGEKPRKAQGSFPGALQVSGYSVYAK